MQVYTCKQERNQDDYATGRHDKTQSIASLRAYTISRLWPVDL